METAKISEMENLAKLRLSQEERGEMEKYFAFAEESFAKMDEVDTGGAEPMIYSIETQNIFREDAAIKEISREELLKNAPEQNDGYFQVPRVVD